MAEELIRLPARRFGVIRRASVWDARDYLLSISGTSFSESYRRFYYRDIKAIVVQKGPRMGSIGGLLLLLSFTIPFMISLLPVPKFNWLCLAPVAWLLWIIYTNLARSCRVFVYTAVSSEEIPAMFRRRSAAKSLPKILNKIAEAQGEFSAVEREAGAEPVFPTVTSVEAQPVHASRQILYAVGAFSILFLASAAFAYWYRNVPSAPSAVLNMKIFLSVLDALEVATGIWALFKLFRVRLLNSLRICIFAGLGVLAIRSYALLFTMSVMDQPRNPLYAAWVKLGVRYWIGTFDSGLSLLVALAGLISLMLLWHDERQLPATAETGGSLSSL